MHITKIELEDIKSHKAATFEFERGTTAITGANGAGKTTLSKPSRGLCLICSIIKKTISSGAARKKAWSTSLLKAVWTSGSIAFIATRERVITFTISQLKKRIADKKDEVTRFLWQHLGVEAGTDLEALFRRAIGVPQGTFTAIFLETAAERKKAFDKLLKVEEYRQGAEKLRETARYIETQITGRQRKNRPRRRRTRAV